MVAQSKGRWAPQAPPAMSQPETQALANWSQNQLDMLTKSLSKVPFTQQEVLHVEPIKPRDGMVVIADGSDWNPGSGPGQYTYVNGVWVLSSAGEGTGPVSFGEAYNDLSADAQDWLEGGFGPTTGPTSTLQVIAIDPPLNWDAGTIAGIVEHTVSNPTELTPAGIYGAGFGNFGGAVTGHMVRGGDFDGLMVGAGTCDIVNGSVHYAQQSSGTVGTIAGLRASTYQEAGTATNIYGVHIMDVFAGGTITGDTAGLKVDDLVAGAAIMTGANPAQFGGPLGYGPAGRGIGDVVTQPTSKATNITLDKICGQITTAADALAAGATVTFLCSNSFVEDSDVVVVSVQSATTSLAYRVTTARIVGGSFGVQLTNISAGSLSQAVVINFAVIKSVYT